MDARITRARGSALVLIFFLIPVSASAHHGRDYLNVRSADLPHPGQVFFVPRCDYMTEGGSGETELEPSLLCGVLPWLSAEVHAHIAAEEGESFVYEATAPSLELSLPGERAWGVALTAEYEVAAQEGGPDRGETIGMVSGNLGGPMYALNVRCSVEEHASADWGYAAGLRSRAAPGLSFGLEAQGGFASDAEQEVLLGLYMDPDPHATLNLGLGTGMGPHGPDVTLRTSLVWQIR